LGYKNDSHWADRICAVLGAIAALGIAFFPTKEPEGMKPLDWWEPWIGIVHHACAAILFGIFALYCLWLFRKRGSVSGADDGKQTRNNFYLACGVAILFCMGWAALNASKGASIFWPESFALGAFALSWLVKGYAATSVKAVARSWLVPDVEDEQTSKR
jgi:hypothetical protein